MSVQNGPSKRLGIGDGRNGSVFSKGVTWSDWLFSMIILVAMWRENKIGRRVISHGNNIFLQLREYVSMAAAEGMKKSRVN